MYMNTVPAKLLDQYINIPDCVIVDLRSEQEYRKGHVQSAINVPYEEIEHCSYIFKEYKKVVLYCARGNLSLLVARCYANSSAEIINIYGGIHAYRGKLVK